MELSLERPLLFFDIESTGLNIVNDCIVELSFVKVFPDGHHDVKTWRVCPWDYTLRKQHPINPEASQVNGVKMRMSQRRRNSSRLRPKSWIG